MFWIGTDGVEVNNGRQGVNACRFYCLMVQFLIESGVVNGPGLVRRI
jgi:hypothetical protein